MASTSFTDLVTLTSASWFNQVDTVAYAYLTGVAGTDTITATGPVSMTAYAAGQKFHFISVGANTGAVTLNITPSGGAALGAKAVTKNGSTALASGDIPSGAAVDVTYDGTRFIIGTITLGTMATQPLNVASKQIYGLAYSNSGVDATNDINISAGGCMDATGAYWMTGTAKTKQLDAAWAVGDNAGGLDTGSIGNNGYYIWAIARSDTGVVDYLFSLSATAPTMPANYDYKRLIGWIKRESAAIATFVAHETEGGGLEYNWVVPALDVDLSNTLTTSVRYDALRVPLNLEVVASINVLAGDAANALVWVFSPDHTPAAPSLAAAPLATLFNHATVGVATANIKVRTSNTGQIGAQASVATVDAYRVSTLGFTWSRRT